MSSPYESWRGTARTMAVAVDDAVIAAQAGDAAAFDEALGRLRTLDRPHLLALLGSAMLDLLERAAPDGLDAEEAERVLRGCLTAAAPWFDALDGAALLAAFTAGVGVADPDDTEGAPTADAVLAHGLLLVAQLCTTTRTPVPEVLTHSLAELRRAQTVEMP